jgi:hypothetical protein
MSKTGAKSTERKMEYVEITQAEEMPVLSAKEKAELIQSLKDAQERIARGEGIDLGPGGIGRWLRERPERARAERSSNSVASKSTPLRALRQMEYVQFTQAEEMPALSKTGKAKLIRSIEEAMAEADRGECVEFKEGEFARWADERMAFHRGKLRG